MQTKRTQSNPAPLAHVTRTQSSKTFHAIDISTYEIETGRIETECGLTLVDSACGPISYAEVDCGHCARRLRSAVAA